MYTYTLNGKLKESTKSKSILDLIAELDLQNKKIAIEKNGEIISKSRHTTVLLEQGDIIEIVTAVGGG